MTLVVAVALGSLVGFVVSLVVAFWLYCDGVLE